MKHLISLLLVVGVPFQSFAVTSPCTLENSQKLLDLAAKFIGESISDDVKLNKVLLANDLPESKEIRRQYLDIRKASQATTAANELMAFSKAHPECDKKGQFRMIHPIN